MEQLSTIIIAQFKRAEDAIDEDKWDVAEAILEPLLPLSELLSQLMQSEIVGAQTQIRTLRAIGEPDPRPFKMERT
jgi:hypothetical protein